MEKATKLVARYLSKYNLYRLDSYFLFPGVLANH